MKDGKAKVAVIMSVYRSDKLDYLVQAINSILNQSYPCTLYIYQDGPIPDGIKNYLAIICEQHNNVRVINASENNGLAFALNYMIDLAIKDGYDFIARMDSDDISRHDRIENQVNYLLNKSDIDVLGTSCREFGATFALDQKHLPQDHIDLVNFSVARCPFIHPTVMFRAKVFQSGIRYPTNTNLTEDMALWFDLIKCGYKLANLNEVLLDYRLNEDAIKRRQGFSKAKSEFIVRFKYMQSSKNNSLKNLTLISSRLVFHILPLPILKLMYKFAR
ncbi:TPA: glycosyltransferase [Vibrio cholerae]|uniref:glycosyltransferase n=1 Tax=Vibrio cholerae TaxID=666 RepID=UPI0011D70518|nr:glycosyltransferase [Vibrio cholerae]EGR4342624.1 glycosyltransferase [Vibrio cholerae]EII2378225.1 glycosyltransferase [Vibrio cholerae]EJL6915740.1 glycosyltransferase [Vibrio cholerae]TXX63467.1 glycosyltransferase [Vibrio cholerae]BCN17716.1 UDP-Gal:alpha-D-GlcNAc-diphosphoundecaprenol beta-1,3-galactosyltransferase [Vibrio cholerae]